MTVPRRPSLSDGPQRPRRARPGPASSRLREESRFSVISSTPASRSPPARRSSVPAANIVNGTSVTALLGQPLRAPARSPPGGCARGAATHHRRWPAAVTPRRSPRRGRSADAAAAPASARRRSDRSRPARRGTRPASLVQICFSAASCSSISAPAGGGVGAVVAHLLPVPADADAEGDPPVGDQVEAGDLLRGVDDVALRQQHDPGAEHQPRGHRGDRAQRDERVQRPVVPPRQLATGRVRRLPADRDVGVLGDEQRVETPLLQRAPQHVRPDALVGDERGDPEPHRVSHTRPSPAPNVAATERP